MKRLLLGIAAVTSMLATGALAADLPARTYTKAPVYVDPGYNWSGFYVGLNGGYSWGNASNTIATTVPLAAGSQHMDGWVFGGQVGYNWQYGKSWVFGLEADIDATGQDGTALFGPVTTVVVTAPPPFNALVLPTRTTTTTATGSLEEKLPWLSTFRGRIGVLPTDRVLLYITGGLAVGEVKSTAGASVTTTTALTFGTPPGPATVAALAGSSSTRAGWTLGAGVEGVISGNWTARLEYLYVDLGTVNNTFAGTAPFAPIVTSAHVTDNILRAGFNYRFGGPVVAKY
jgi:outer membrane immunogenic protein